MSPVYYTQQPTLCTKRWATVTVETRFIGIKLYSLTRHQRSHTTTSQMVKYTSINIYMKFLQCLDSWLGGRKGIQTECSGAGMIIYHWRGADLHMVQLMQLPLTVSCFSKIQIGFTFMAPAHPGSPRQKTSKWVFYMYQYDSNDDTSSS